MPHPLSPQQSSIFFFRELISRLPKPQIKPLPKPTYSYRSDGMKVGLGVESMREHITDEGYVLFEGLKCAGYHLAGKDYPLNTTDVRQILKLTDPSVCVIQDKREWDNDLQRRDYRDKGAFFNHIGELRNKDNIFKLTVIKDAHQRPIYHMDSAKEMGVHAWITYYHPTTITHLAPYVRAETLIRVYHSITPSLVPSYTADSRNGTVLSGAIGTAYPLRKNLLKHLNILPETTYFQHPGYGRGKCHTPDYLKALSMFKVSICTSSMFGYALRKIIESTACGCIVLTDLPIEDKIPFIDDNLVRIHPNTPPREVADLLKQLTEAYDPERQEYFAKLTCAYYDWREAGLRLCSDIEHLRSSYNG